MALLEFRLFSISVATMVIGLGFSTSEELGCKSWNSKYEIGNEALKNPVYGSKPEALNIDNVEDLKYILQQIKEINANILKDYPFNSMDDYLEFYADYKSSKKDLESFFKSYKPKFHGRSGFVDFPVELLTQTTKILQKKWKSISHSMFLAATQLKLDIEEEDMKNLNENFLKTIMGKKVNNVFAALKFSLSGHVGHILLNPGFGTNEPILVMKDGGNPLKDNIARHFDVTNDVSFETSKSDNNFIIGRQKNSKDTISDIQYVIYVGLSYCSILDITQKMELLRYDRYLLKRDTLGMTIAGLSFDAFPADHYLDNEENRTVKAFLKDIETNTADIRLIKLSKFNNKLLILAHLSTNERIFLEKIAEHLGTTRSALDDKLHKFADIVHDDDFLKNTYKMLRNVRKTSQVNDEQRSVIDEIVKVPADFSFDMFDDDDEEEDDESFLHWTLRNAMEKIGLKAKEDDDE